MKYTYNMNRARYDRSPDAFNKVGYELRTRFPLAIKLNTLDKNIGKSYNLSLLNDAKNMKRPISKLDFLGR